MLSDAEFFALQATLTGVKLKNSHTNTLKAVNVPAIKYQENECGEVRISSGGKWKAYAN